MAKVSIGLRGWRFDEEEVFTEAGEFRPLTEIPEEARHRLVRLSLVVDRPCDACYLEHGDAETERCRPAAIVYGEPLDEVLLCDAHEADFLYWFREHGGRELAGDDAFRDTFHEWFAGGGRAPEGYGGIDHVETDPDALPDPPDPKEIQRRLEAAAGFEGERIDLREGTPLEGRRPGDDTHVHAEDETEGDRDGEGADETSANGSETDDTDDADIDVDLGAEYPTR
jgi:hypothetical protein